MLWFLLPHSILAVAVLDFHDSYYLDTGAVLANFTAGKVHYTSNMVQHNACHNVLLLNDQLLQLDEFQV